MKIFVNLSNHPTSKWGSEQLAAARNLGEKIIDVPFPMIAPDATHQDVLDAAFACYKEIESLCDPELNDVTIHVMGEMTFTYNFINVASLDCDCVASTTERISVENSDGTKTSTFKFVQFRLY